MYTPSALLDMHTRSQRSLRGLITHCGALSAEELARELPGFGYPAVRVQLAHLIGGQEYWIGVLQGRYEVSEDEPLFANISEIEAYRQRVALVTAAYLESASEAELNTPRKMMTWPKTERELMPAHVVVRTLVHIYDHKGQVAAMCRTMGKPIPAGLDFPLV
jgi:uncharacterized damage-inducible protein DinB